MRIAAMVLTMAALFAWARVGPAALAAGLFTLLGLLAFESRTGWAKALDASVDASVHQHRNPGLMREVGNIWGHLGEPAHVALFAVVVGALLSWRAGSVVRGVVLGGAVGVGVVLEYAIKSVLVSFPSGHVMGTTTLLGLIAVFLADGRGLFVKAAWAGVAAAGVVFVASMALYSGAHTVSDVLGGLVLGSAMVSLGVALVRAVESRKRPAHRGRSTADTSVRSRVPVA